MPSSGSCNFRTSTKSDITALNTCIWGVRKLDKMEQPADCCHALAIVSTCGCGNVKTAKGTHTYPCLILTIILIQLLLQYACSKNILCTFDYSSNSLYLYSQLALVFILSALENRFCSIDLLIDNIYSIIQQRSNVSHTPCFRNPLWEIRLKYDILVNEMQIPIQGYL